MRVRSHNLRYCQRWRIFLLRRATKPFFFLPVLFLYLCSSVGIFPFFSRASGRARRVVLGLFAVGIQCCYYFFTRFLFHAWSFSSLALCCKTHVGLCYEQCAIIVDGWLCFVAGRASVPPCLASRFFPVSVILKRPFENLLDVLPPNSCELFLEMCRNSGHCACCPSLRCKSRHFVCLHLKLIPYMHLLELIFITNGFCKESVSNDLNLNSAVLFEHDSLVALAGPVDACAWHGWLQLFGALLETSSLCSGLPAWCRFALARGAGRQQRIRAHLGKLCMLIRASLVLSANAARFCFSSRYFIFVYEGAQLSPSKYSSTWRRIISTLPLYNLKQHQNGIISLLHVPDALSTFLFVLETGGNYL